MRKMPHILKQQLRSYARAVVKASVLHARLAEELENYNVPYENLVANVDWLEKEPRTEALAHINYGQGDIEENIKDIEEVFLYFVNKENRTE